MHSAEAVCGYQRAVLWEYEQSVDSSMLFFVSQKRAKVRVYHLQVWRCTTISNLMINEQIRDKEVRLIGADGAQLGIMSAKEAMFKAQEAGLDLVKIAPQAKPPVCKIIDYGKYRYELSRKEKRSQKETEND